MDDLVPVFADLFRGRTDAIGLQRGGVERREVTRGDYEGHLNGHRSIGIFPMLDSAHVWFGAIDLDEPDFALAAQLKALIPSPSWIEQSKSGNAHVWVFFAGPTPAWAVRAVLKGATQSIGKPEVEVFPKQDGLKPGMVGNYINLPWFGQERPILARWAPDLLVPGGRARTLSEMHYARHTPLDWERRARLLGGAPPEERENAREFGTQKYLHQCAVWIIDRRESNPLRTGARHSVLFALAKMTLNWAQNTPEEAWQQVSSVNDASEAPLPEQELRRLFENAQRGEWTSTGCDAPELAPYIDPDCPIANGSRNDS